MHFKFVFQGYLNVDLTVSHNAVAIPRKKQGVLIDIGCIEQAEKHFEKDVNHAVYNDMCHIYVKFHQLFFSITKGYLKVTECPNKMFESRLMPV